jgi:insecticidal toxin complex protein TccC
MDNFTVHHATPTLTVMDPRGLAVRDVVYRRSKVGQTAQARATQRLFDTAGRAVEQWDSRLSIPALRRGYSLLGQVLATVSVDAGWRLVLSGQAGEPLNAWDSRGTRQDHQNDLLLRPLAVMEQAPGDAMHIVERFQ